jgi:hypothetical protein
MTNSIFIESREWFDKSGGNSYFSSRVSIDGAYVYASGMTYGYDTQHIHEAIAELIRRGYLSEDLTSVYKIREAGIALYFVKYDTPKRDLFPATEYNYELEKSA